MSQLEQEGDTNAGIEDEVNPFESLCSREEEDLIEILAAQDRSRSTTTPFSRTIQRDWGIPTFSDQIDKGICRFELVHPSDINNKLCIQLEHRKHSTGSDLWDSALVLAYGLPGILKTPNLRNKTVLELGSGTGAVGLYCSKCLGAKRVVVTDLAENLDLIRRNRDENGLDEDAVEIFALDWTHDELPDEITERNPTGFDIILGSDLCEFFHTDDDNDERFVLSIGSLSPFFNSLSPSICPVFVGAIGQNDHNLVAFAQSNYY
jgi:SAM-dependent methyltransferase